MITRFKFEPIKVGDNLKKAWPKTNALGQAVVALSEQLLAAQMEIEALKKQRIVRSFFPFCIYRYTSALRASPAPTTDWRTVRVRGGTIFVNATEVVVTGTDEADNPYSGAFGTPSSADIVCTASTAKFWIWIVISDWDTTPTAAIASGATPPTWDSTHIPIGWVDTDTEGDEKVILIRQFVATDLITFIC